MNKESDVSWTVVISIICLSIASCVHTDQITELKKTIKKLEEAKSKDE